MKKKLLTLVLALGLAGCMHVDERISINADGSALVRTQLKVHAGTVQMVDAMFGGMLQAFAQMGGKDDGGKPPEPPESVAEKMFANKDDILDKIKKSGLDARLESFSSQKQDGALLVDYTLRAADVVALAGSKLLMTRVRIMRNAQGDWFCRAIADKDQKKDGESQKADFEKFQDSPQFKSMPADMQQKLKDSVMDFKAAFLVIFPAPVSEATGLFEKKDGNSAGFGFNMAMLTDPGQYARMMSAAATQMARTGSGPVPPGFFDPAPGEGSAAEGTAAKDVKASPDAAVSPHAKVKVRLKNGTVTEGLLLEKNADFVKMDFGGVAITYYNDEIETVE